MRLGLDEAVRAALAATFERWNGRGLPSRAQGHGDPPARCGSPSSARSSRSWPASRASTAPSRSSSDGGGKAYDPELADLVLDDAAGWWDDVEPADPWDAALAVAPPSGPLERRGRPRGAARPGRLRRPQVTVDERPFAGGRRARSGGVWTDGRGGRPGPRPRPRRGARTRIWDKPGPLTRDERDRAETHALVTDQLLRRVPYTATLAGPAGAAHERLDGSGYHRRAQRRPPRRSPAGARRRRLLPGDDSDRPYRAALSRRRRGRPSCGP